MWRRKIPTKAPRTAMGVPKSTLKGSDQLSYWAARIRKTNSSESAKMTDTGTPSRACFSWKLMPR